MNMNKALQNLYHAVSGSTTTKVNISKLLVDIHQAITSKESPNKNNWAKIINSMADNWPGGGGGSSDFSTATVTIVNNIPNDVTILLPEFYHVNNHEITDYQSGFVINEDTGIGTSVSDGWAANYGTTHEYIAYLIPSYNFGLYGAALANKFERITVSGLAEKSYITEEGSNFNTIIITGDCTITIS